MKNKIFFIAFNGMFILLVLLTSLYTCTFMLIGNKKVEVGFKDDYKDNGFVANFLNISLKKYVKIKNNVDTTKLGNYKVIYELPFKKIEREVDVIDNKEPIITLNGLNEINLTYKNEYFEEGYSAIDNYDGDITDKVVVENNIDNSKLGLYQVKYSVVDSSNNKSEIIRTIKVVDDVKPVITLKGNKKITIKVNGDYQEEGFFANDNYDGNLTDKVKITNNINYKQVGTYNINYEVSDSNNNSTIEKRVVNVIENVNITYIKGILLVNKKYHLPSNYNPGVNSEAYNALLKLQKDGMNNGYPLPLLSGFRSYNTQKNLYNSYVQKDGVALASTYSARPGESEHQTGLAFDVGKISNSFGSTDAGIWLKENAHRYGFIIRYLKGKESITGYKYEPWHIRYVGVEVATEIYNQGITLEEYLGVA